MNLQDSRADSYRYAVQPQTDDPKGKKGKKAKKDDKLDDLKQELEMVSLCSQLNILCQPLKTMMSWSVVFVAG